MAHKTASLVDAHGVLLMILTARNHVDNGMDRCTRRNVATVLVLTAVVVYYVTPLTT